MIGPARAWRDVRTNLWFVPGAILLAAAALAFGLIEIDRRLSPHFGFAFNGDAAAARTVLSVLAGSLITVAGVSLSLTVLVLQLASSQFSPRVLPSFLGDGLTQVTVGGFVGIFTFSLIALRSVESGFVPHLTVTVASALGILSVVLLVAFIHHVSRIIQVSQIAARIGAATLRRLEVLYPEPFGHSGEEGNADLLVSEWRRTARPHPIAAGRPGYVKEIDLHLVAKPLDGQSARVHVIVAPGDFVAPDDVLAEYWGDGWESAERAIRRAIGLGNERSLDSDLAFGIRQLTDIALRALSPSLNDPTTARTCIGYIRAVLDGLAGRDLPPRRRDFDDTDAVVVTTRREFPDYLQAIVEIARFAGPAVEVTEALVRACESAGGRAEQAGAADRAAAAGVVARAVAELGYYERSSRTSCAAATAMP